MTLITGQVADVGMNNASGVFYARATEFRGDGTTVVSPSPATFTITGGVVSAEVEPGPTIITLHVGPVRKDWFVNVPETDVGLGDLIATYMEYEPAVVSAAIKARDEAIQAESEAKQAAIDAEAKRVAAETAANLTGQDRLHVDNVRALLDETYDESQAGQALPPRLTETALNATYGPDIMQGVIEVEAESPTGLIARKGGKTKTDGQNVENLRRPTLVVDRMYPEGRADHMIVYVDEATRLAYSIGRDHKFRAAEWVNAPDMATFWQPARSTAPDNCVWANNFFMRESTTGALLMDQFDANTGTTSVIRSTDAGFNWSTVFTYPGPNVKYPLGPQSIAQDPVTGYLYMPEYHWQVSATTTDIWRSTDAGATWQVWVSMPRHNSDPGTIRHWHSARWDPVSQRMYFTAGDMNDIGGIYRVNADGSGVEPVILNKQLEWNVYFPGIGYPARAVDVMFFPDYIAWGNDGGAGESGQNYVYRMARSEIGKANPVVEQVAAIDNTGWYCQNASEDGTTWIVSSSNEEGGGPNPDEGVAHLYAITDNGSRVDEVAAVVMDGTGYTIPSLAGFGNGGGQGNAFWLRATNYSPTRTGGGIHLQSAFQMRCRLAYGVVPLIKPVSVNKLSYRDEHFNWYGSLAAGETQAFAHATVPQRTTRMVIYNYGHRMANPAATPTIVLEVYNDSTGQVLFTSTGPTVRDSRWVHPTAEFLTEILGLAAGAQLLFRVRNTGTGETPVAGLAHISVGFGFPT